ncbi:hypothetical protein [Streptomyces sp. NPDC005438]|uniref:imidazolonepropionase-like domain-containing protein n=1 Tax=Streptomyces sp. NPDC005438 TaxID=3156880 RepID=UPI0033A25AC0
MTRVLHAAEELLPALGAEPVPDGAVLVEGDRVLDLGPLERLREANPTARVRSWAGLLLPGLTHPHTGPLLEAAYHPDPREYAALGDQPLTGPALDALAPDDTRWGGSARRGLQRLLRHGVTEVTGPFHRPPVQVAVRRSGLRSRPPSYAAPSDAGPVLDPLALAPLDEVLLGRLAPGAPADLTVLALTARDLAETRLGGGTDRPECRATVVGGRLLYRGR